MKTCPVCGRDSVPTETCCVPHAYDYGEGGAQPIPPVLETHTFEANFPTSPPIQYHAVMLAGLPESIKPFRYVRWCFGCKSWQGSTAPEMPPCPCSAPRAAEEIALPLHNRETLFRLALARGEQIVCLKAELADAYAQRDKYQARINTAIRKLEGF